MSARLVSKWGLHVHVGEAGGVRRGTEVWDGRGKDASLRRLNRKTPSTPSS